MPAAEPGPQAAPSRRPRRRGRARAASRAAAPAVAAPTSRDWLRPVFRALTAADPDRAGRLLVGLLPAQAAVHAEPIAYDLVLGGREDTIRVTAEDGVVRVLHGEPRPASEVAFSVHR